MKRKMLPVYLNDEERKMLEGLKQAFKKKRLGATLRELVYFVYSLKK